jgi:hypothetical protein
MKLFLDDIRYPIDCAHYMHRDGVDCRIYHEEWTIVRSYKKFVEHILAHGLPEHIAFDHDLADISYNPDLHQETVVWHEKTGYDCAKWLVDYCMDNNLNLPEYTVHSANPEGKKNIQYLLANYTKYKNKEDLKRVTDAIAAANCDMKTIEDHLRLNDALEEKL